MTAMLSNEVKQAAMVQYGDTFTPHMGVDFQDRMMQTFDVLAALSGKVTVVEKNPARRLSGGDHA